MNRKLFLILLNIFIAINYIISQDQPLINKEKFINPPMEHRPNALWFWNNTKVNQKELKKQIKDLKKAGYGGLSILPFGPNFKPDYLSNDYFKAYETCIKESRTLNMTLSIYDEYGFPSGTGGDVNGDGFGRFRDKYPKKTNKRLDKIEITGKEGDMVSKEVNTYELMSIVAMDTITNERINLTNYVKDNNLNWEVPKGNWKVMLFLCKDANNTVIDYLDPHAAKLYIDMVHEKYFNEFSNYFGDVIEGTFFDEPTMYYADGRTWTLDFNKKFEDYHDFSPELLYPALWYDIGPETSEARNYLYGFRSKLFSEGYIKEVSDWSKSKNIYATGHLDNEEILNVVGTSGDLMLSFKHLDIPGIDKIGGDRPAERFYKIISSAAYIWDKSYVMSETYGAMGNIDWNQIFSIAMDQYSKGINMLIPHAVWYDDNNVTFLPELSERNPIYSDSIFVFNQYLSRLNLILRNESKWTGDIAVLYPINSMQSDHYFEGPLDYYQGGVNLPYLDYTDISVFLSDSLGLDHLFIHPEVINEKCIVEDKRIVLNNSSSSFNFSTLIIPSSTTIDIKNLRLIRDFANEGGLVIFSDQIPKRSTEQKYDEELKAIINEILILNNVYYLPSLSIHGLSNILSKHLDLFNLTFISNPVRNISKIFNDKRTIFLANPEDIEIKTTLKIKGNFDFDIWDPHSGDIKQNSNTSKYNNETFIELDIPKFQSLFLIEK